MKIKEISKILNSIRQVGSTTAMLFGTCLYVDFAKNNDRITPIWDGSNGYKIMEKKDPVIIVSSEREVQHLSKKMGRCSLNFVSIDNIDMLTESERKQPIIVDIEVLQILMMRATSEINHLSYENNRLKETINILNNKLDQIENIIDKH